MRWPIVLLRRSTLERVLEKLVTSERERVKQAQALARLGHRLERERRESAEVLRDLRVIRLHLEGGPGYARTGKLRLQVELADGIIFDAYRRSGTFKELVGVLIEEAFMRSPEGREAVIGRVR